MSAHEIDERICWCKANEILSPADDDLLAICQLLNARINELEEQVRRANNVASCLANGIQPD